MPTYIALLNWTDQGVKSFKDSVDRYEDARKQLQGTNVTLRDSYWTLGPYDIVVTFDAPDDETATAGMLAVGAVGNVRSTTMRAFSGAEFKALTEKLP